MRIRPRAETDVEHLLRIVERTHLVDRYPRVLPDVTRTFVASIHEVAAWVAEDDDGVLGQAALLHLGGDDTLRAFTDERGLTDDVLIVGRLFADPDRRGAGAGAGLLASAVAESHRRGKRPILDVMQDAAAAIAVYERAGWQRIGAIVRELREQRFEEWVYLGPPPTSPEK